MTVNLKAVGKFVAPNFQTWHGTKLQLYFSALCPQSGRSFVWMEFFSGLTASALAGSKDEARLYKDNQFHKTFVSSLRLVLSPSVLPIWDT